MSFKVRTTFDDCAREIIDAKTGERFTKERIGGTLLSKIFSSVDSEYEKQEIIDQIYQTEEKLLLTLFIS